MKLLIFLSVITIFLVSSCSTIQVASDYDHSINFKQYKTYAWLQRSDSVHNYFYDNQIIENNVKLYVNNEMKNRGYTIDIINPDVLLEYHSTSQKKTYLVQNPVYSSQSYNYSPAYNNVNMNQLVNNAYGNRIVSMNNGYNVARPYSYNNTPYITGYTNQQVTYDEGTLLVDIVDRKLNRMVWRGWAVGTLVDEMTLEQQLPSDIKRIFKKYPVPLTQAAKKAANKGADDMY